MCMALTFSLRKSAMRIVHATQSVYMDIDIHFIAPLACPRTPHAFHAHLFCMRLVGEVVVCPIQHPKHVLPDAPAQSEMQRKVWGVSLKYLLYLLHQPPPQHMHVPCAQSQTQAPVQLTTHARYTPQLGTSCAPAPPTRQSRAACPRACCNKRWSSGQLLTLKTPVRPQEGWWCPLCRAP